MKKLISLFLLAASFACAQPTANQNYGLNPSGVGGYWTSYVGTGIVISTASIATSGSPADLVTVATGLSRYIVGAVYVESLTAAGSLAIGTVDIQTATAGGGASILSAPVALTGLTTLNLAQSLAPAALGSVLTAANLTLRQTVNSLNAGTIAVVIVLIPVP